MNAYNEFKALPVAEADAICAEKMGWHSKAVSDESGCRLWMNADDRFVIAEDDWSPTTDRNYAAMMVEMVGQEGMNAVVSFAASLTTTDPEYTEGAAVAWCASHWFSLLYTDPCLIAWAACVALEGA